MALNRMKVEWSGSGVVGPGLSVLYFNGSMAGLPAAVLTFFGALASFIPAGTSITVPSNGDVIEESTGELTGVWTASGGGTVSCTGTGVYPAGAGMRVVWNTAGIHLGRRVRGSTFIVPLTSSSFDTNGTINNTGVTATTTAATNLITAAAGAFKIWSRPNDEGMYATNTVTSATVPDKVSTLRSRRT